MPPDVAANFPTGGLSFVSPVTTDPDGVAEVTFTAADPGATRFYFGNGRPSPRVHDDGQLYKVFLSVRDEEPTYRWSLVSVLVWNTYDGAPTWEGGIEDVLRGYHHLYPSMSEPGAGPGIDLSDYGTVVAHRERILRSLTRDVEDPRYMPVTRDLSGSRRRALVEWLTTPGPDGLPLRGEAPGAGGPLPDADRSVPGPDVGADGGADPDGDEVAAVGSKTAAVRGLRAELGALDI